MYDNGGGGGGGGVVVRMKMMMIKVKGVEMTTDHEMMPGEIMWWR